MGNIPQVIYSYRQIVAADLPTVPIEIGSDERRPATVAELANFNIFPIHDDVYAVADHQESEIKLVDGKRVRVWTSVRQLPPGTVLSSGRHDVRHATLPADVRPKVLQADAFRATTPAASALEIVATNLNDQVDAIAEAVGQTDPPLFDPTTEAAVLAEAQRVAGLDPAEISRLRVPMITVDPAADIVVSDNHPPHAWAGETIFTEG